MLALKHWFNTIKRPVMVPQEG